MKNYIKIFVVMSIALFAGIMHGTDQSTYSIHDIISGKTYKVNFDSNTTVNNVIQQIKKQIGQPDANVMINGQSDSNAHFSDLIQQGAKYNMPPTVIVRPKSTGSQLHLPNSPLI